MRQPAVLGGEPAFKPSLPFVRPALPSASEIEDDLRTMLGSGQLTNNGPFVQELERSLCSTLGIEHCAAVANCTSGLMLALAALDRRGEVLCPSFTFAAAAQAILWSGNEPRYLDIEPESWALDPAGVQAALGPQTVAVMALHPYGVPAAAPVLERCCAAAGVPLIFDSAHAFGSRLDGVPAGAFGLAEVFSFHATKLLPMGEGGAVVSANPEFIERVRQLRNFGIAGDQEAQLQGLNGKMQEFNAILGLHLLPSSARIIARRRGSVRRLRSLLAGIPGLQFQTVPPGYEENGQYFPVLVHEAEFGLDRQQLAAALAAEGVGTRCYFSPPLHQQRAFAAAGLKLPVTEAVSRNVLCLPVHTEMEPDDLERLAMVVRSIRQESLAVRCALQH